MKMDQERKNCKQCGESVVRVNSGTFASAKNRKYVDEHGKLWNGKNCPACHRKNARERIYKQRAIEFNVNNLNDFKPLIKKD